jgi:hypothetical protein
MKTKAITTITITLFLASIMAIAVPVSAEYGTPTIDGVISAGEWGVLTFRGYDYNVYVLNDDSFLYVAFEADGGDFTLYPGMTNIYIYAGSDYAGECLAYTALGQDEVVGLTYFTTHHIQPPKVKEGQASRSTLAEVEASTLVMEWKIPLDELWLDLSLVDSMSFDFLSYSEGMSGWVTAWMYEQYYTLAQPPPEYWVKASGGGEFYDDYPYFKGHHCTIGLIGMSLTAVPEGVTTDYKGSGVFVDHDLKFIIQLDITSGRLTKTAKKEVQFWGTARVKDINLKEKWTGTFWIGLVDDEYGVTNRFAIHLWQDGVSKYGVWHGTLLPESEVTVWFWE